MAATPPDKTPSPDPAKENKPASTGTSPVDTGNAAAENVAPENAESSARDKGTKAAQAREIKRQEAMLEAVEKAGKHDLPKLGGPLKEPGLGR